MKFQSLETSKEYYKSGVIGTLRHEISILEDGIVDYCEYIDKLKAENKELKKEYDKLDDLIKEVILKDTESRAKKNEKIEELKTQLNKSNNIAIEKNDEINELKLALVDQNDDIKTLKSNQDKLKLVIENQEDEIKELKHELNHKAIKLHQDRIPKEYEY